MTVQLCCRDVGLNCDFEARGDTEEEVLQKTSAHARWVHQVTQMSLELENRIRAAIRTV